MLLLTSTADKIQVVTSAADAVDVHASFMDYAVGPPESTTPGRRNTAIASAATTDVVLAPGASVQRNVKYLTLRMKGTGPVTVTVQHTDGTTTVEITSKILDSDHRELQYIDGLGFLVL